MSSAARSTSPLPAAVSDAGWKSPPTASTDSIARSRAGAHAHVGVPARYASVWPGPPPQRGGTVRALEVILARSRRLGGGSASLGRCGGSGFGSELRIRFGRATDRTRRLLGGFAGTRRTLLQLRHN